MILFLAGIAKELQERFTDFLCQSVYVYLFLLMSGLRLKQNITTEDGRMDS